MYAYQRLIFQNKARIFGHSSYLNLALSKYEKIYGREDTDNNPNERLIGLVTRAYEQTGEKVVVINDEYDAPLLDVVHEEENLATIQQIDDKGYLIPYSADGKRMFKIGINFDSNQRTITDWIIKEG